MLNNLLLKLRVYSLDIDNIPKGDRLDLTRDAMLFLSKYYKGMTNKELVDYIKWEYLKMLILHHGCISEKSLLVLLNELDLNKIHRVYTEHFDITRHLENANNNICKKIVFPDDEYHSTFYAFVYDVSDKVQEVYVHNHHVYVDEFK